ncbi:MAG: polyphosphate polymerase domain-containing protein [Clostridiales Family XIII bacterium]|jgi:hypothetical protein|nr:polyphosphate polymerase domain-containing protein [Clostridiales Family XIII bacterium]
MAIEIFNRYENKYMIDDDVYEKLQGKLVDYMDLDSYNKKHALYPICNLYYDTPDSHLIRTSLQKPDYKEKLRIRSYGTPDAGSKVYIEIKKKFCKLVNKRRSALPLQESYAFLSSGVLPETIHPAWGANRQVLSEIQYILQQYTLRPQLFLSYERRAFFGAGKRDLRISFDTNITTRRSDLRLESGIYGSKLLPTGKWLMEVKTAENIPLWLCRLLSEYKIYPISFSKYGTEYRQILSSEIQMQKVG